MILSGDIAQPYIGASSYILPDELRSKFWLGNLEGSLLNRGFEKNQNSGVYNDSEAIKDLLKQIPFKVFNLANNHILDAAGIKDTIDSAHELGIQVVGAGYRLRDAQQPLSFTDTDGTPYCIVAFGWENIQCVPATAKGQGVNPYTKSNVMISVKEAILHSQQVICFLHWNYELEKYPQPYDRQLAHDLIDLGVEAVVGCHAHRVQPIEFYKGKPIVYGLGNFLFCQGHYFGGQLYFPQFCEEEYAFEITGEGYKLHYFNYNAKENRLNYIKSAVISQGTDFEGKAVFSDFSAKEYEEFFSVHRVQKKLLPIFKTTESTISFWIKSEWIKLRGQLLDVAMRLNIKSAKRVER